MEKEEVQKIKKPSLKFTPLNIIVAISLVGAIHFATLSTGNTMERGMNGLFFALCMLAVFVFAVSDLIFRKVFPSLKKLWIVELSFIAFAIIMTLILKIVIFN